MGGASDVANVLRSATANAGALEQANQQAAAADPNAPQTSAFDVWRHTGRGLERRMQDPSSGGDPDAALIEGLVGDWLSSSADGVAGSLEAQAAGAWRDFQLLTGMREAAPGEAAPKGALATIGATFGLLTSLEQMISAPLSMIPFPAFPAIRVMDFDVGLPHAHNHPPNLIPPAPPVPLPSTGPIIPIPFLSGATKTLINGMPAARCGDMGLGVWCGGYFPMYEVFLGSSSVWIEGARAGRLLVDITKHCTFSSPKPSDPPMGPMVGMTISSSGNVLIGGVPMPSLLNLALGQLMRGLFSGLGRALRRLRAIRRARAVRRAAAAVDDMASRTARVRPPRMPAPVYWQRYMRLTGGDLRMAIRMRARAHRRVEDMLRNDRLRIGGDPAFQRLVMDDLCMMASTRTGREALERIRRSPHRVLIEPTPAGRGAHCSRGGPGGLFDARQGRPGSGSNSIVRYDPNRMSSPNTPPDATLNHEMGHAANNASGTNRGSSPADPDTGRRFPHMEEQNVIQQVDNPYRREHGLPERWSHSHLP